MAEKLIHNWKHAIIAPYLLEVFLRDKSHLLLLAAADDTKRWNLTIVLDYENMGLNDFGGTVNYDKRRRQFNFIQYSDQHNFAVRFSIASGSRYSVWKHRDFLFYHVPEYYHPNNKLADWLLSH